MATSRETSDFSHADLQAANSYQNVTQESLLASQSRDEAGIANIRLIAGAAALSLAAGIIGQITGLVKVETERTLSVSDVTAGLTSITPIREQCWVEYGSKISVTSEYTEKDSITTPFGTITQPGFTAPKFKQIMTEAPFGNKVCNPETAMTLTEGEDGKIDIKMADDTPFKVTVYLTNPVKDVFKSDPNWVAGNAGAMESLIQGMPLPEGFTPDTVENIDDFLQATDVMVGSEASAKACAPVAWEEASPAIKENIIDSVYEDYKIFAQLKGETELLPRNMFTVDLPKDPVFPSQYTDATEQIKAKEGLTVQFPDLDSLTCEKTELAGAS